MPQSPDIGQSSDWDISDFRISGQSLIKGNGHNSRTSDDIVLKLGSETKLDKRNKIAPKKVDDVMSENCDVIAIFLIYGQFGVIRKPDSGRTFCKTFLSIITFNLTKTENN